MAIEEIRMPPVLSNPVGSDGIPDEDSLILMTIFFQGRISPAARTKECNAAKEKDINSLRHKLSPYLP